MTPDLITQLRKALAFDEEWARIIFRAACSKGLPSLDLMRIENARNAKVDEALVGIVSRFVELQDVEIGEPFSQEDRLNVNEALERLSQALER